MRNKNDPNHKTFSYLYLFSQPFMLQTDYKSNQTRNSAHETRRDNISFDILSHAQSQSLRSTRANQIYLFHGIFCA